ncbi:DNA-directed RNA polymerase subunit delta [bacterium]|jgi:DNA-directed RNA polymerase subunit delta|nr:DNA-directed RNA polymerase subunit delta [bacterium]
MINEKSMIQIAYEILKKKKKPLAFNKLWEEVCKAAKIEKSAIEELISSFYTDLTLDGRIVTLGENVWDLRERNTYDKVHIDMNEVYAIDEEEEKDEDDEKELGEEEIDEEEEEEDEDSDNY